MKKIRQVMKIHNNEKGSALPYVFGWLMGVPVSILFLIFMLRSIF